MSTKPFHHSRVTEYSCVNLRFHRKGEEEGAYFKDLYIYEDSSLYEYFHKRFRGLGRKTLDTIMKTIDEDTYERAFIQEKYALLGLLDELKTIQSRRKVVVDRWFY